MLPTFPSPLVPISEDAERQTSFDVMYGEDHVRRSVATGYDRMGLGTPEWNTRRKDLGGIKDNHRLGRQWLPVLFTFPASLSADDPAVLVSGNYLPLIVSHIRNSSRGLRAEE